MGAGSTSAQPCVCAVLASKVSHLEVAADQMPCAVLALEVSHLKVAAGHMSCAVLASEVSHLEVVADQMSSDSRRAMPCSSTATRRPARSSSSADAPPNLRAEQSPTHICDRLCRG